MRVRLRTYTAYSVASAIVWMALLVITGRTADEERRRAARSVCAGWWLGWLSATIARRVYPAPSGTS